MDIIKMQFIRLFDTHNLIKYLKDENYPLVVDILRHRDIDGRRFLELTELELIKWKLNPKQKKIILDCRNDILRKNTEKIKVKPDVPKRLERPKPPEQPISEKNKMKPLVSNKTEKSSKRIYQLQIAQELKNKLNANLGATSTAGPKHELSQVPENNYVDMNAKSPLNGQPPMLPNNEFQQGVPPVKPSYQSLQVPPIKPNIPSRQNVPAVKSNNKSRQDVAVSPANLVLNTKKQQLLADNFNQRRSTEPPPLPNRRTQVPDPHIDYNDANDYEDLDEPGEETFNKKDTVLKYDDPKSSRQSHQHITSNHVKRLNGGSGIVPETDKLELKQNDALQNSEKTISPENEDEYLIPSEAGNPMKSKPQPLIMKKNWTDFRKGLWSTCPPVPPLPIKPFMVEENIYETEPSEEAQFNIYEMEPEDIAPPRLSKFTENVRHRRKAPDMSNHNKLSKQVFPDSENFPPPPPEFLYEVEPDETKKKLPVRVPYDNHRLGPQPRKVDGPIWNISQVSDLPKPPSFKNKFEKSQLQLLRSLDEDVNHRASVDFLSLPYYRDTNGKGAKEILQKIRNLPDGAFVLRKSEGYCMAITMYYRQHFYNVGINKNNYDMFYFETDNGEHRPSFRTIPEFVDFYKAHSFTVRTKEGEIDIILKDVLTKVN